MTMMKCLSQKSHMWSGRKDVIMENKNKCRRASGNNPVLVFGLILVQTEPKLITGQEEQLQIQQSLDHL